MKIDFLKYEILLNNDEFLRGFLASIGLIGTNKEKVFNYIIQNANKDKLFLESQKSVSQYLNISYPIVSNVFTTLIENEILYKVSNTQYLLKCSLKEYKIVKDDN